MPPRRGRADVRAWVVVALVALAVVAPTASAGHRLWIGLGTGTAQAQPADECAAAYEATLARTQPFGSWHVEVRVNAYPNRWEVFGCLPREHEFIGVAGGPREGWEGTSVLSCTISHIRIGPVGGLVAGVAELVFDTGNYCSGALEHGEASLLFATPETA